MCRESQMIMSYRSLTVKGSITPNFYTIQVHKSVGRWNCSCRLTEKIFVHCFDSRTRTLSSPTQIFTLLCREYLKRSEQKGALAAVCTPTIKSASRKLQTPPYRSTVTECLWRRIIELLLTSLSLQPLVRTVSKRVKWLERVCNESKRTSLSFQRSLYTLGFSAYCHMAFLT